jgi:hypothetical protein
LHLTLQRWHCLQLVKGGIFFCNAISSLLLLLVIITDLCSIYLLVVEEQKAYICSLWVDLRQHNAEPESHLCLKEIWIVFISFAWECRDVFCLVVVGGPECEDGVAVQIFERSQFWDGGFSFCLLCWFRSGYGALLFILGVDCYRDLVGVLSCAWSSFSRMRS